MSRCGLLVNLELRSNPEVLCVVRSAVNRLAEVVGFSPSGSRAITRAVDEAIANIIRHAYKERGEQPIQVACRRIRGRSNGVSREGLEIVLVDRGPAVDRAKLHGRPLGELRPGGLGLHFMRQSMDMVQFRRIRGKNQLRLVKYLGPKPSAQRRCL